MRLHTIGTRLWRSFCLREKTTSPSTTAYVNSRLAVAPISAVQPAIALRSESAPTRSAARPGLSPETRRSSPHPPRPSRPRWNTSSGSVLSYGPPARGLEPTRGVPLTASGSSPRLPWPGIRRFLTLRWLRLWAGYILYAAGGRAVIPGGNQRFALPGDLRPVLYMDAPTETPSKDSTEVWADHEPDGPHTLDLHWLVQ